MIKEQMKNYFQKIDKFGSIIRILLIFVFLFGMLALSKKWVNVSILELILAIIVIHLMVTVRIHSLKQNAMIRWINNNSE